MNELYLKMIIKGKYKSLKNFCEQHNNELSLTYCRFHQKLKNGDFSLKQIDKISSILKLTDEDFVKIWKSK